MPSIDTTKEVIQRTKNTLRTELKVIVALLEADDHIAFKRYAYSILTNAECWCVSEDII